MQTFFCVWGDYLKMLFIHFGFRVAVVYKFQGGMKTDSYQTMFIPYNTAFYYVCVI